MAEGGALAGSVGQVIGVGEGRGMALLFMVAGLALIVVAVASALMPAVRLLEDRVPDYLADDKPKRDDLTDGLVTVPSGD